MQATAARASTSGQGLLERRGRDVLEREIEDGAVGAEAFEGPREVRLDRNALGAAGCDDAEEDAGAVRALGAAGEEDVEAELRDVLELALGRRVVDGERRSSTKRKSASRWFL
jgi:hypothetical protein